MTAEQYASILKLYNFTTYCYDEATKLSGQTFYKNQENNFIDNGINENNDIIIQLPTELNLVLHYNVYIMLNNLINNPFFDDFDECFVCNCKPYVVNKECKHITASLLFLKNKYEYLMATINVNEPNSPSLENTTFKCLEAATIIDTIKIFTNNYKLSYADNQNAQILDVLPSFLKGYYYEKRNLIHTIEIHCDDSLSFTTSCTCSKNKPCTHVFIVLNAIINNNVNWLLKNYNFITEKKRLAQTIGVPITDAIIDAYSFKFNDHKRLEIIKPANLISDLSSTKFNFSKILTQKTSTPKTSFNIENIGFVFNLNTYKFNNNSFELVHIKQNIKGEKTNLDKISEKYLEDALNKQFSENFIYKYLNISQQRLMSYAATNVHSRYSNEYYFNNYMDADHLFILKEYVFDNLKSIWADILPLSNIYYTNLAGKVAFKNHIPITLSAEPYTIKFNFNDMVGISKFNLNIYLPNQTDFLVQDLKVYSGFIIYNNTLYMANSFDVSEILNEFGLDIKFIANDIKQRFKEVVLAPLMQKYEVIINDTEIVKTTIIAEPMPRVLFSDNDGMLQLTLQMQYDDEVTDLNNEEEIREITLTEIKIYERNKEAELHLVNLVKSMHASFEFINGSVFNINFNDARKDLWFIHTIENLQNQNIAIFGANDLKAFKTSSKKAKMQMSTSSGIDWFDVNIEVSFGDEIIALSQIKKAIANGTMAVPLKNGSLGLLPADWAKKYGVLLNVGKLTNNDIKISKLHFTLIDGLTNQIDEAAILAELAEKKQRLTNIESVKTKPLSKKITATLRPYQKHSLGWLQVLDDMRWGACLADDMGLGKTLQSISFLQFVKEKYKGQTSLIICPTSLIYNWQAELEKFAPTMKFHIHYGNGRHEISTYFGKVDLIITTYGMMRSDIEDFIKLTWQYIILDESQAIKNPMALTTKATQLLQAHNRIILSGTPIQNNTMDLYAQFQFLNPGLLGNFEFFKDNFSNPIDKHNDADAAQQLKQLIYPFLLRRTKEQVAKDLPAKIETILWCEMDKKQRKVYNEYKDYYKKLLLQKIDEVGMAKAGIYVIEGLLRLRQICDSPLLVKNEKVAISNSVKIEELIRELTENTGNNKVLVFSQFVEMLTLIEEELIKNNISFVKLTGSTPANKRKEYVHQFQTDETTKVFLISIKAGGVGLNLTKANYVYIVDPWWNPAVEQQAIDRTHRIGQTQQIFAYKMICKDSVEEKIVQLQQKKKQLSDDLITEDAGFIKKLSRDDVAFLFG